jgi:hypothetical protein
MLFEKLDETVILNDPDHPKLHSDVNKAVNLLGAALDSGLDESNLTPQVVNKINNPAVTLNLDPAGSLTVASVVQPSGEIVNYIKVPIDFINNAIAAWMSLHGGGSGTIFPAAPTSVSNDVNNTQSWTHPLFSSALEYRTNEDDSTIANFIAPIQVGDVERAAKYYEARVKATDGRAVSAWSPSDAFTKLPVLPNIMHGENINVGNWGGSNMGNDYASDADNGTLAPDGSNTLLRLRCFSPASSIYYNTLDSAVITVGSEYTFSIYVKKYALDKLTISMNDTIQASYDLTLGTIFDKTAEGTPSIVDLSSLGPQYAGWYRIAMSIQSSVANIGVSIIPIGAQGTGDGMLVWHPMLNTGLVAAAYSTTI